MIQTNAPLVAGDLAALRETERAAAERVVAISAMRTSMVGLYIRGVGSTTVVRTLCWQRR